MKNWQFFAIMWALCSIAYQASAQQEFVMLLAAVGFAVASSIALMLKIMR